MLAETRDRMTLAEVMISQNQSEVTLLKDKLKLLLDYYTNLNKRQDPVEESLKDFF